MNKQLIINIVLECVEEINHILEDPIPVQEGELAYLYDWGYGNLDSFSLVSLLVCIEQALEDQLHLKLDLVNLNNIADQNNPFRTVATLVNYISDLSNVNDLKNESEIKT
ncbi:acyl carrier protein [Salipaludibacillus sp. LMS25]|jgi:acyl carrier protein|uniref:acyl carrier protein n=1 Tax=Salipaludibacillus sp. LMS25 TaxID=2924031 RepID=UPI0020D11A8C|nr:acyl carrier protein [Salipaludibacillus sp. LMS25]UTR16853.1 acyl carrier protein [Salipaludibacillus sp. LMS25]